MRDAGRPGMSDEQVRDFCSCYMPAYRAYLPGLYKEMEAQQRIGRAGASGDGQALVIEIGKDRNPVC